MTEILTYQEGGGRGIQLTPIACSGSKFAERSSNKKTEKEELGKGKNKGILNPGVSITFSISIC